MDDKLNDEHLQAARARQADPAMLRDAQRRMDAINRQMRALGLNDAATSMQKEPTREGKVIWMRRVTDLLAAATKGYVPCKAGCAHCCHMATLITVEEAETIAAATGRPMTMPPPEEFERENTDAEVAQYEGTPCSLLVDGKCSVYAQRPFACRVHYSLDRDNLLCKIVPGELIRTPSLNTRQLNLLNLMSYPDPRAVRFADIRAFFPARIADAEAGGGDA